MMTTILEVLDGPVPSSEGLLAFRVKFGELTFFAHLYAAGGIGTTDGIPLDAANAAMRFISDFAQREPVRVHRLLIKARSMSDPSWALDVRRIPVKDPSLDSAGNLVFEVPFCDSAVVLKVSPSLCPLRGRLRSGEPCTEKEYFEAYYAALDYMIGHADELEQSGFDVAQLRAQLAAFVDPNEGPQDIA